MKKLLVVSTFVLNLMVSPCFAIEFGGDIQGEAANFEVFFRLEDVPEPLITAAMLIEYDPNLLKINTATFTDTWDQGMSNGSPVPGEPGKYILTAGNLSNANPDGNDSIGIATVVLNCLVGNCAGQQITVSTVSGFDSVVGNDSGNVYDSQIEPKTFTIPQGTTTTTTTTTTTGDSSCLSEVIYGENSAETELLRSIRDKVLRKSQEGRKLIRIYYLWSPVIVKAMEEDAEFKHEVEDLINEILPLIEESME